MELKELARGNARAELLRGFDVPDGRALSVGLTGGIGTGKSTVAAAFGALGAVVVDADRLAHEVVEPGTPGLAAVVEAFGGGVLRADGSLDRAALGRLVFADAERRRRLESITHPLIARAAVAAMTAVPADGVGVYDVPLLVEQHMESQFDCVVVVDAPMEQRLERLAARGLSREDAESRIAVQASDQERRAVAHVWLTNAGTVEDVAQLGRLVWTGWFGRQGGPASGEGPFDRD